jgi:hypothetical protein
MDQHDDVERLPARAERTACRLVQWRPWKGDNPHLVGHADVSFNGLVIHSVPIFLTREGTWSVGFPTAAQIDAEGKIKLKDGKRQYASVVSVESYEAKERWQSAILRALYAAGIGTGP